MEKKFYYILSTIFIITAGVLYSFERFIAYLSWIGEMNAKTGSWSVNPTLPGLLTNIFISIFIIIGICLFVSGYKKK